MTAFQTTNPTTGLKIKDYKLQDETQVMSQIVSSHQAFLAWRFVSIQDRLNLFKKLILVLNHHKKECAELMALEMGKPIQDGVAEIEKCALLCEYYLLHAEVFLEPKFLATEYHQSFVVHNPLGLVLAIMPWNFPFWQALRAIIPALIAGNAVLLKHAKNVTGSAIKIESLFLEAGFPKDILKTLLIGHDTIPNIIAHPHVQGVTLTGSEEAGKNIAQCAGKHIKKVVLELGGNDAAIVLSDANLEYTACAIINSRLRNSGQVCVSSKRVIVDKRISAKLIQQLQLEMKQFAVGDPLDKKTMMGPMARDDLRTQIHEQVKRAIGHGAKCLLGGVIPKGDGFFYPPTLLVDVLKDSNVFSEEFFGPVVSVIEFNDEEEAIELANATNYGLGAAIFSSDLEKAQYMASYLIDAGLCYVNMPVRSDPRFPFGGIKNSGFGRELSREGLLEFTNTKTVIVNAI